MDDPNLPCEYFRNSALEDPEAAKWIEGIVVGELTGKYCNLIYQYGQRQLLYLKRFEFIEQKPAIGHVRDATSFPDEQRINYQRVGDSYEIIRPRDMGRFSFCHARCVRGVEENEDTFYIDLLRVTIRFDDNSPVKNIVPPGVAFVAKIKYDYDDVSGATEPLVCNISFSLGDFVDYSVEDIPFDKLKWKKRDVTNFLPEQLPFDYTRKFEPILKDSYFAIYIGDGVFVALRDTQIYIQKGYHDCKVELVLGKLYSIDVVPNRLAGNGPLLYSTAILEVSRDAFHKKVAASKRVPEQFLRSLEKAAWEENTAITYVNF